MLTIKVKKAKKKFYEGFTKSKIPLSLACLKIYSFAESGN